MAYDVSALVTEVQNRAKDTSFNSDLITGFLASTQAQALNRSRFSFMEDSITPSVSQGDTDYTLGTDIETVLSLKLIDANDQVVIPQYIGYAQFYETCDPEVASQGVPRYYTIYGSTVVWDVPLHQAWTLHLRYLRAATLLVNSTDVPDVPERYKELLVRGALARVEEYRGNFDIAGVHDRKVEELTEDMLGRLSLRQLATSHKSRFGRKPDGDW